MFVKLGKFFRDTFTPFQVIAHEMRRMNDLKELELEERLNPKTGEVSPVIVRSESPGKNDTEVFFGSEEPQHGVKSMREALTRQWVNEADEDDE